MWYGTLKRVGIGWQRHKAVLINYCTEPLVAMSPRLRSESLS
jgi:hypothetical protein